MWFATKSIDIILIYYFWFVISWKSRRKCVINKNNKVTQQSNKYEIWYHSLFNLMFILLRCSNINVFKTILHTINTLPQEKLKTTKHVFFLRSTFEFHRTPSKHCSINRIISVAFTVTYVWIIEEKQRKNTNLWKHSFLTSLVGNIAHNAKLLKTDRSLIMIYGMNQQNWNFKTDICKKCIFYRN